MNEQNNVVFILTYSFYEEDNLYNHEIVGVYDSFEKAVDVMNREAKVIEINNTIDDKLYYDHKSTARHYIHYYNDGNATNELLMIYTRSVE